VRGFPKNNTNTGFKLKKTLKLLILVSLFKQNTYYSYSIYCDIQFLGIKINPENLIDITNCSVE